MAIQHRDWTFVKAASKGAVRCPICEKPSRSERGNRAHYLACHATSARSERNWMIASMYFEEDRDADSIGRVMGVSKGAVLRVINTVLQYPFHYELDPVFLEPAKVTPLRRRA